ncbi:transcription factor LBX1-like [Scleropages formosus]|uniref:Transcription factor LBX1-like n=1 Tax=Scleropages formosus TaxID=113540 RepID=A0A0P7TQZ2_SCLFO|nr:transcription factor LBX1-like [Scleropages formosus]
MTSSRDAAADSVLRRGGEGSARSPPDRPPTAGSSTKPLTPFGIEDILKKPAVKSAAALWPPRNRVKSRTPPSPLCALEELASKTLKGLEVTVIGAAEEGRELSRAFSQRHPSKKRRKSRTAFTNHQIYELENRFLYQKYLSPADRDQMAQQLGLSNAQVITWFQNRRAKLKRDLEEMKADVESLKRIPPQDLQKLVIAEDIEDTRASPCVSPSSPHRSFPRSPSWSREQTTDEFSEEEQIDVDD